MDVVVNAAVSVDGKLSSREREQIAISGPADFERVDRLRAESDAVVVGIGTVLADDPSLTVKRAALRTERLDRGDPPNPARVVADSRARTPPDAAVLDDEAETYLLASDAAPSGNVSRLQEAGATVLRAGEERVDLQGGFDQLQNEGIDRLLVEGGGELIASLFEAELVDRLSVFVGSTVIGDREAPTLADGEGFVSGFPQLELVDVYRLDDGVVLEYDV